MAQFQQPASTPTPSLFPTDEWGPPVSSFSLPQPFPRSLTHRKPQPAPRSRSPLPTISLPRASLSFERQKPEPQPPAPIPPFSTPSRSRNGANVAENPATLAAFNSPIRALSASVLHTGELPSSPASSPSILLAKRGTPLCRPQSSGELHGRRPWRVPLGTFPGRAKCSSEFALPLSSSLCTRFGKSWSGVPVLRAPASRP